DYVVVSAYSQSDGTLSVYSGGSALWRAGHGARLLRWEKPGPLSQPVLDRKGENVFVVQKGQLQKYDILNGQPACTSAETALAATSNLVLDGDENLYFWNDGILYGYRNNCQALFQQRLNVLPKDLELLFGQDGTLYARTATQQLFSLTPIPPQPL